MIYKPSAIAAADRTAANKPALGGEFKLYISNEAATQVGELRYTATATATYVAEQGVDLSADPADLQAVVSTYLTAAANVVITVVGTDAADAPITGTATFAPPAYAQNQTASFAIGAAVDVVVSGGTKFKTVTSVAATSNGNAGSRVAIFRLPNENSWQLVGCLDGFDPKIGTPSSVHIPCGMDASAFIVPGRSEQSTVSIRTKHFSLADGLARTAGRNVSIRCDRLASGIFLTERWICGNAVLSVNPNVGTGSDEVTQMAEGGFATFANFWAQ